MLQALLWLRWLVAVCLKRIVVIRVDLMLAQRMRRCRLLLAAALLMPLVMLPGQQLRRVALVAQRRQRLVIVIRVICELDEKSDMGISLVCSRFAIDLGKLFCARLLPTTNLQSC